MKDGFAESQCAINPLDLVTAVFMSANTFLQQEMTVHMVKCQFAMPLVLPTIDPEEPSHFLLWPLRGVVGQWKSHFPDKNWKIHEGNMASTNMPMVSCVKLGRCGVSKSQVLHNVIRSTSETFLHRGIDGRELPRRLSNGLVEHGISPLETLPQIFSLWSSLIYVVMPVHMRHTSAFYVKCLQLWLSSVGILKRKKNNFLLPAKIRQASS